MYVQAFGLKIHAALYQRLINSPITRGEAMFRNRLLLFFAVAVYGVFFIIMTFLILGPILNNLRISYSPLN